MMTSPFHINIQDSSESKQKSCDFYTKLGNFKKDSRMCNLKKPDAKKVILSSRQLTESDIHRYIFVTVAVFYFQDKSMFFPNFPKIANILK